MRTKGAILLSAGLHAASLVLMIRQVEPFYSLAYVFLWWTYIYVMAKLNDPYGNSWVLRSPRSFLQLCFFSTVVWLFFEAYNLRLQNWAYLGVPASEWLRLPGYFPAFGTVLPGLFETATWLENHSFAAGKRGRAVQIHPGLLPRLCALGVLMMAAPLLSPDIFFPLVWIGLIFALDPVLIWLGASERSLLYRASKGDYTRLLTLFAAGTLCGFLWEFWNFWSGAKWFYTLPHLDFLKIFEMPLLGYLGFPVFAVECYLVYEVGLLVWRRYVAPRKLGWLVISLGCLFVAAAIYGVEQHSIASYRMLF